MKLSYTFYQPVGKEYYSSERDETFQDDEAVDYEYDVSEDAQCKALAEIYSDINEPLEEQAKDIIKGLLTEREIKAIKDDADKKTLDGVISEAILYLMQMKKELTICNLLPVLLGEVEYFTERITEVLTGHFEGDAKTDFIENN